MKLRISIGLLLALGCSSDHIHRTDLHSWKSVELPTEGIVLDVPVDAFKLQMHYRSNGIADATWMISVSIERKAAASFATPLLPSPRNRLSSDAEYMKWLRWIQSFHGKLSVYEMEDGLKQYRRDVSLENGDVASIHATYHYSSFSEAERIADDAAIRRIIESARPIAR